MLLRVKAASKGLPEDWVFNCHIIWIHVSLTFKLEHDILRAKSGSIYYRQFTNDSAPGAGNVQFIMGITNSIALAGDRPAAWS